MGTDTTIHTEVRVGQTNNRTLTVAEIQAEINAALDVVTAYRNSYHKVVTPSTFYNTLINLRSVINDAINEYEIDDSVDTQTDSLRYILKNR